MTAPTSISQWEAGLPESRGCQPIRIERVLALGEARKRPLARPGHTASCGVIALAGASASGPSLQLPLEKDKNIFFPLLMTHYNIKKSFPLFLIKKFVKICLALWKTRLYINISHTENLFIDFSLIISTVDTILKVLSLKPDTSVRVNRSCISFW